MCLMKCSDIIVVNKCGILSQSSIIIVLIIKFLFYLGIIFVLIMLILKVSSSAIVSIIDGPTKINHRIDGEYTYQEFTSQI